jgi:ribosomal protein L10
MLAGVMQAPAGKLARLLNATLSQFIYAMQALKQKREA